MITDEVLEIPRINPPQTADFDRSQRPVLDAAAHGFLVDVQDFRRFRDGAERLQLLHGVSSLIPVLVRFRHSRPRARRRLLLYMAKPLRA